MSAEFIVELWSQLKSVVPAKDRLDVADILVRVCDEYGLSDGIDEHEDLDKELGAAVKSYYGHEDEDEEDYGY